MFHKNNNKYPFDFLLCVAPIPAICCLYVVYRCWWIYRNNYWYMQCIHNCFIFVRDSSLKWETPLFNDELKLAKIFTHMFNLHWHINMDLWVKAYLHLLALEVRRFIDVGGHDCSWPTLALESTLLTLLQSHSVFGVFDRDSSAVLKVSERCQEHDCNQPKECDDML